MPQIDLRMDASQVTQASNQLVAQLQSVESRIASVTSTVAQFNTLGNQVGAVVKGLTRDGQQYTATLGILDKDQQKLAGAVRGASAALDVQSVKFKQTSAEVDKNRDRLSGLETAMNRVSRAAQYFVAYRGFNFITSQIEDGIRAANQFQIQLSLIRTLSQQNQQNSATFGAQVRASSDRSGFNVADTGRAFYDAISNQVAKGPEVQRFVDIISDLARVTGSNLVDAGNAVTATINAYGLSVDDAQRVSAVLFRTVDEGRVVMSELANTLGRVQVLAANVGVSMEEVSSVLAVTTQKGFKTSDAMTLLTNLLIKLEKPTEATKKFFEGLGVSSGEEAIRLFGFYGVMQKIIDLTRSGQVPVSAFFDEIRGRKQFAVFEQSIDRMRAFNDEISNTAQNVAHYQQAINIRGESPADYLNRELNKLQNIFTVDVGQKILETTAKIVQATKSISDSAEPVINVLSPALKTATALVAFYTLGVIGMTAKNYLAATSFTTMGGAAVASLNGIIARAGPIIAALYAVYEVTRLVSTVARNVYGSQDRDVDAAAIQRSIDRLNDLRRQEATRNARDRVDPQAQSLDFVANRATDAFRRTAGVIAQVNLANNRMLEEARVKARETAEAVRVAFTGFTDTIQQNINLVRQRITQTRDEIRRSQASLVSFQDTLDNLIAQTQEHFATDAQRVDLFANRIAATQQRAVTLLGSNDPAEIAEGRRLFDEAARLIQQREQLREQLNAGRSRAGGGGFYMYSTAQLQRELAALRAVREEAERGVRERAGRSLVADQATVTAETARLTRLQNAMRAFSELTPFDASGGIRAEFRNQQGRFDPARFSAAQDQAIAAIRANAGGTAEQRFQLEIDIARQRMALQREAAAQERRDIIEAAQARLNAQQEAFNQQIQLQREARRRLEEQQRTSRGALADIASQFDAFRNASAQAARPTVGGRVLDIVPEPVRRELDLLDERIREYRRLVALLDTNANIVDGRRVARPEDIENVRRAALAVQRQQDAVNAANGGRIPTVNGAQSTQAQEAVIRELQALAGSTNAFNQSLVAQQALERQLTQLVNGPLRELRAAFPELATAADDAFNNIRTQTTQTITQGLQPLIDKIRELQEELRRLPAAPAAGAPRAAVDFGGEVGYASSGGLVGFPGKPRGTDRYPYWLTKDEYVVNAQSSKMFRPMLEAINSRRAPRYMAQGGVVGGDTNVGDVSITVNGSQSPTETGRAVWAKLQREIRRGNIKPRN